MILSFSLNACIIITFLSVVQHARREKDIFQAKSFLGKTSFGIYFGVLGVILMLNSVRITSDVILDFRHIPVLLSAFYGGLYTSIITSAIIAVFRFLFLGISSSSINGATAALLMGIQINNLIENADTALYQAKKTGRNKVVLYDGNRG